MPLNMHRSTCLKVFIERRGRKNLTSDARATVPCSCTIGGVCRQLRPLPMLSHLRAPGRRPCMPDAARSQRPKLLDEVDKRLHLPSDSRHMGAYPADHYHISFVLDGKFPRTCQEGGEDTPKETQGKEDVLSLVRIKQSTTAPIQATFRSKIFGPPTMPLPSRCPGSGAARAFLRPLPRRHLWLLRVHVRERTKVAK